MKKRSWYSFKASADSSTAEISIYDEIGDWGVSAKDFLRDLKSLPQQAQVTLRINSPGGEIVAGHAIFNAIQRHPGGVVTVIDGMAASMASVIALAGKTVAMAKNGLFMIHNPWGFAMGDSEGLQKTADLLDKMKGLILDVYEAKTGKARDELSRLMDEETWLTADEALEMGFIDTIGEPTVALASANGLFNLGERWPKGAERLAALIPADGGTAPAGAAPLTTPEGEMKKSDLNREGAKGAKPEQKNEGEPETPEAPTPGSALVVDPKSAPAEPEVDEAVQAVNRMRADAALVPTLRNEVTTLKASLETAQSEKAAIQQQYDRLKGSLGLNPAAVVPQVPVGQEAEMTAEDIKAKYEAMPYGNDRLEFFRKHKAVLTRDTGGGK